MPEDNNLKLIIEKIFDELKEIKELMGKSNDDFRSKIESLERRVFQLETAKSIIWGIMGNGWIQKILVFGLIGLGSYCVGHYDLIVKILGALK